MFKLVILFAVLLLALVNAQGDDDTMIAFVAKNPKCYAAIMADSPTSFATGTGTSAADPYVYEYTYTKACPACFEEMGVCFTTLSEMAELFTSGKATYKEYARKFYDCKAGKTVTTSTVDDQTDDNGGVTTTTTYYNKDVSTICELKPNSSYYAVIIVPVLAFSFTLMGLAYYFLRVRGPAYAPPSEKKSTEMTNV